MQADITTNLIKKLLLLKNDADNLFESGLTVNGEAGVTFFE